MNHVETWEIKGYTLEYINEIHQYLVNGVCIPSITQLMKIKFKNKYDGIDKKVLQRAANKGTEVHEAIELYEKEGKESNVPELRNYKFLKKHYKWEVIESEIPIILFKDEKPIAAGRLDQVIKIGEELGINDLKRTSAFDREYVALQTNLYRIGYQQSYDKKIDFVSGTHLRDNTRKYYKLPVNEEYTNSVIEEFIKEIENGK